MKKLRTAVLFSGGKDSGLALAYALEHTDVACLISMQSTNVASYMFHTPNIQWVETQAERTGIPLILHATAGVKEKELDDLKAAIKKAITAYAINAVVTGAIESVYQASRIQKICDELGIECFNPLWQKDQFALLEELVAKKFGIIIIGTFGEGLDAFLGKTIDKKFIEDIRKVHEKLKINPAGEGGEFESFVLNAPYYKKPLIITKSRHVKDAEGGRILVIDELA